MLKCTDFTSLYTRSILLYATVVYSIRILPTLFCLIILCVPGICNEWKNSNVKEHKTESQKPECGRKVFDVSNSLKNNSYRQNLDLCETGEIFKLLNYILFYFFKSKSSFSKIIVVCLTQKKRKKNKAAGIFCRMLNAKCNK